MSDEQPGVFVPLDKMFSELSETLKNGFAHQEKRSDGIEKKLDARLEELRKLLEVKADANTVKELEKRLIQHEIDTDKRLRPLEIAALAERDVTTWKDKVGGAAVLFAASSVGAFLYYIVSLGHH